tara:strand:- start:5914 stop:7590 length:1677 start_codon:yes stop_codon:yes gene_type:complete
MEHSKLGGSDQLLQKWAPVLKGIDNDYTSRVTAQLLENQAKQILSEKEQLQEEALTPGSTTVGQMGTFQKFAFPLVRRVFPQLIFNYIGGVQPMSGPVSQIFYLGHSRAGNLGGTYGAQAVYSKYNLTYRGLAASAIGSSQVGATAVSTGTWESQGNTTGGLDGEAAVNGFDVSNVLQTGTSGIGTDTILDGSPSATYGGHIASFPDPKTTLGWNVSAGEQLRTSGIPELTFHIEQQPVVSRTRKMRALWTIEASQDLKAYHNLDLERELTELLSKEVQLEIDRELVEDIRMVAYGLVNAANYAGWDANTLNNSNSNNFGDVGGNSPNATGGSDTFSASAWTYDQTSLPTANNTGSNVFVVDFTASGLLGMSPRHVGDVWANLMGVINLASQDIYRTTQRGPGTVLVTSPLIATLLETAAKLEYGMAREDAPTNMGATIEYKGKLAGKYDLIVDPLFPEDEILMCYKGSNAMDAGFVYAPYIPLQQLPTITDPETFQPRKGILTRYGKAAITPQARFYRIIRVVGPTSNHLLNPFARNTAIANNAAGTAVFGTNTLSW